MATVVVSREREKVGWSAVVTLFHGDPRVWKGRCARPQAESGTIQDLPMVNAVERNTVDLQINWVTKMKYEA